MKIDVQSKAVLSSTHLKMSKTQSTLFFALLASAIGSCAQMHSADDLGDPLVTLTGSIEGDAPDGVVAEEVRVSLIWASLPQEMADCLDEAEGSDSIGACVGTNAFVPALTSRSVDITPVFPASFELPLHTLPSPDVLSGSSDALFSYGILVGFEDGNQNEKLDLVGPEATDSIDRVVASSMGTGSIDFVVYREGELSSLWKMFSGAGCPTELPVGFSVVHLDASSCVVANASDQTISLVFDDSGDVRNLICEPQVPPSTFPASAPPQGATVTCHSATALEFVPDPSRYCKHEVLYDLAGCDSSVCNEPEWDLRGNPPSWWPCSNETSDGFLLSDQPGALTDGGGDALFRITYVSGGATYALTALNIWVATSADGYTSLYAPEFFSHTDNDDDGVFSQGDELIAFEPAGLNLLGTDHEPQMAVRLMEDLGHDPINGIAEFLWNPDDI